MSNAAGNDMSFKYLLQDFSRYYIGARMTYDELIDHEDMPGKFRSAIFRYMEDEVSMDTTVARHLLSMDPKSKSAMIYDQLQAEITVLPNQEAGRSKQIIVKATDLFSQQWKEADLQDSEISEVRFKKRNLMFLRV